MGAIMYAGPKLSESPYAYLLDPVSAHFIFHLVDWSILNNSLNGVLKRKNTRKSVFSLTIFM